MGDFSDFQRGQIVDAHLAGTSVTKMTTRAAVARVMTTYTQIMGEHQVRGIVVKNQN